MQEMEGGLLELWLPSHAMLGTPGLEQVQTLARIQETGKDIYHICRISELFDV